ncbi:MAG TPA: hypothetical protein VIV60_34945 [Polyangiaceae bacterium]
MFKFDYRNLLFVTVSVAAASLFPSIGVAQEKAVCGEQIKAEVAKLLAVDAFQQDPTSDTALAYQTKIYEQYSFCSKDAQDIKALPITTTREYCGNLAYLGNTMFEKMRCCGYDPQKKLFGCPVEVLLPWGFGPAPFPGSYENVLTCVDLGSGYEPVARDRVHLADAVSGSPIWNFAVIAKATGKLVESPLLGQTLKARSILSWGFMPTSCKFRPYWGDIIDYQIRLDP